MSHMNTDDDLLTVMNHGNSHVETMIAWSTSEAFPVDGGDRTTEVEGDQPDQVAYCATLHSNI